MWFDRGYRPHRAAGSSREHTMRAILVGIVLSAFAATAFAEGETCSARSAEKKLAGAAKTSFMKKCTEDAKAACESASAEKKLAGAAKTSFMKKCEKDAVGG
jgi:hypothetical protein